mmetsp:Transcript_13030/g.40632  ORF Transcript_13030/g.40632 Transcript_13030/m.40632 type:complete len:201 (+) Transcript_13030:208-810(+)
MAPGAVDVSAMAPPPLPASGCPCGKVCGACERGTCCACVACVAASASLWRRGCCCCCAPSEGHCSSTCACNGGGAPAGGWPATSGANPRAMPGGNAPLYAPPAGGWPCSCEATAWPLASGARSSRAGCCCCCCCCGYGSTCGDRPPSCCAMCGCAWPRAPSSPPPRGAPLRSVPSAGKAAENASCARWSGRRASCCICTA